MQKHPGGYEHTARLLELAELKPCRILDMGAGDGETVRLLSSLGYDAVGIDLCASEGIHCGDMLKNPFPDGSFDAVISECAFYVSGDPETAMREAHRLLRHGGKLLLADVCFAGHGGLVEHLEGAGFHVTTSEDVTADWREYYLRCVWDGSANEICAGISKKTCNYFLTVCERI